MSKSGRVRVRGGLLAGAAALWLASSALAQDATSGTAGTPPSPAPSSQVAIPSAPAEATTLPAPGGVATTPASQGGSRPVVAPAPEDSSAQAAPPNAPSALPPSGVPSAPPPPPSDVVRNGDPRLAGMPDGFGVAPAPPLPPPSANAMENLIRLLVQQKVITLEAGKALMNQAQVEANTAQARLAAEAPAAPGTVRVPYIPQVVKDQIRDELKQSVMKEAQEARWVSPNTLPDWVSRVRISGDFRLRSQSQWYGKGNATDLIDFARFNANGPTDITSTSPTGFPILNSTRDIENQLSIRARLGVTADITKGVTVGFRLASGGDNGPVSTTQLLGGGFGKKDIWLDQAWARIAPVDFASLTVGRMPNPFVSTDLVYDEDVNFDGVAASVTGKDLLAQGLTLTATGGAFPYGYVGGNFPDNSEAKVAPRSKYIYGGQIVADYAPGDKLDLKLAAAYYDFWHVRGELSQPCQIFDSGTECSSDPSTPDFLQKGNTLFLIRNILPDPTNPLNFAQPQFAGLLMDYDILDLNLQGSWRFSNRFALTLAGDYARNLGYHRSDVCARLPYGLPINNIQQSGSGNTNPCAADASGQTAIFQSGPNAWLVRATFGSPELRTRGQWNIVGAYKYIEPDAVLDALTDSDFHLGGTNARGYILQAYYMLFDSVRFGARWFSANEVFGPPLKIDVLQADLVMSF